MIKILDQLKNFVRPSEHSLFSPSAGDRWIACPFSIAESKNIPNETSVYAEEGTLAHTVCEDVFRRDFFFTPIPMHTQMQMANLPDMGEEMMNCAESYVELLEAWLKMESLGEILWYGLEKGIPIVAEKDCYGTADFVIVGSKGCAVIDFKYGKGKEVKHGSTQLKLYALGLWRHIKDLPEDYEFNAVVYQPRKSAIPKVDVYYDADFEEFYPEVFYAINEANTGYVENSKLEPCEGSHCFWCPLKRTKDPALKCPLMKAKAEKVMNENFDNFFADMNTPANVSTEADIRRDKALMKILALAPLVARMAKEAEEELQYRIEQGEAVQGCSIIPVSGRRVWSEKDPEKMGEMIVAKFPEQITQGHITKTVKKALTITEVEKVVGKNKIDTLVTIPIKKKLHVADEKQQEILSTLSEYSKMMTQS